MFAYAGIGSRRITFEEEKAIRRIAKKLSELNFWLYSGRADGADIAFELGADSNKSVIMLPWKDFNGKVFSNKSFVVGDKEEGLSAIDYFHPFPRGLSRGGRALMCRNYYQVHGYDRYPQVEFVLCCAGVDHNGKVCGGTGHAVRIAIDKGIPYFNIREHGWEDRLMDLVNVLLF